MKLFYSLIWGACYLLSFLPFRVLYILSDLLYLLIYRIVGYRRKVVRNNLSNSFPEKTQKELRDIEAKFYKSLCDYFVETLKMRTISKSKVSYCMEFDGLDEIDRLVSEGKSVVLYIAHSFNWEYITSIPLYMKRQDALFAQIYHPLENKFFDKAFIKLRERFGSICIPMARTLRKIVDYNREGKRFVIGFLADQVPTWEAINHWVTFMHQDTPVFTGTEKIARRVGAAVFYLSMSRVERGHYKASIVKICENAAETNEFVVTNEYFRLVEKDLNREPWLWLWSHKRWKRTREGYARREQKRAEDKRRLVERAKSAETMSL